MTIIAYDGHTLAADRRVTIGALKTQTTKIFRTPKGGLVGGSGDGPMVRLLIKWVLDVQIHADYPAGNKDNEADMLYIAPDKQIWLYSTNHIALCIEAPFHAIGSGSEFAIAAMYLGKTAREAVEVACALSHTCGDGIDELEHFA